MWKNMAESGACALHAGYPRLHTHTHTHRICSSFLLFHYNNGCTKALYLSVMRTLPVLLEYVAADENCALLGFYSTTSLIPY